MSKAETENPLDCFSKPAEITDAEPQAVQAGQFNDTSLKNMIPRATPCNRRLNTLYSFLNFSLNLPLQYFT